MRSGGPCGPVPAARSAATMLVAMVALATAEPAAAQVPDRAGLPPVIELPAGLEEVLRAYEAAWSARDAEALAALFTESGYALRPGRPPVTGRAALREVYANSGGPLALRAYAYAMDGNVAHIIGGFGLDAASREVGKFVLALERGPDGDWLIAADIDNGN